MQVATAPISRAEDGQPQGLPLQQVCRGLFSYQSLMSVVTDTTWNEKGLESSFSVGRRPGHGFPRTRE